MTLFPFSNGSLISWFSLTPTQATIHLTPALARILVVGDNMSLARYQLLFHSLSYLSSVTLFTTDDYMMAPPVFRNLLSLLFPPLGTFAFSRLLYFPTLIFCTIIFLTNVIYLFFFKIIYYKCPKNNLPFMLRTLF